MSTNLSNARIYSSSCLIQPGDKFLQWCLKYTAEYSVSFHWTCADCFYKYSLSKIPIYTNPVVLDLEIKGTTSLKKHYGHQRICTTLVLLNLLCVVTPSCWNQKSCSSTSNMDMKFVISSWYCSAVTIPMNGTDFSPSRHTISQIN